MASSSGAHLSNSWCVTSAVFSGRDTAALPGCGRRALQSVKPYSLLKQIPAEIEHRILPVAASSTVTVRFPVGTCKRSQRQLTQIKQCA
jgi:hypothetical protein